MLKVLPCSFRNLVLVCAILLMSTAARASHIVGVDLFYTWITGDQYEITLIAYGDCGPASSAAFSTLNYASPKICIYDGNTYVNSVNLTVQAPSAGVEITPVCAADINNTQCTNTSFSIPGIKKFVYKGTYTTPHHSTQWRFLYLGYMGSASGAGRAAAITNIGSGTVIQLVDTLNNSVHHNSSPALTVVPTPFFCLNSPDNYNPGAVDPDLDSLSFFLVPGMGTGSSGSTCTPTGAVTYNPPYTATAPLGTLAGSFSFDQATGQISFNPNIIQRALVVYNVEEYRNDTLIGTSQREMTFLVLTCTNTAPTGGLTSATNGNIDDPTHFHICQNNGVFSFTVNASEPDLANNITMSSTGMPAGLTFTVANNGTNHPVATVTGNSNIITPGFYTFYITYTDDNCPLAGTQTLAFTVEILPIPTLSYTIISPANCAGNAVISVTPGGLGNPWTVNTYNQAGTLLDTHANILTNYLDTLAPGNDTFKIYSSLSTFCNAVIPFTVAPPTFVVPTATADSPSACGMSDGAITLSGLDNNELDTIKYSFNGVPQPPVVVFTTTTGTAQLTNLCAGTYSNITVSWGVCTSPAAGPVTLYTRPFTMSYVDTIQSPTGCGYSDGIIKVHGLHPGQTDTLRYDLNGVPQTPIVTYVGVDSTITVSGLIAGTYSNFIANTVGSCPNSPGCTSNVLGPVTLIPKLLHAAFTDSVFLGCHQDTVKFFNNSTPSGLYYNWSFGDGATDTAMMPTHMYYPVGPTTYTVTLHVSNGYCIDSTPLAVPFTDIVHASFTQAPTIAVCQGSDITFTNTSTGINNSYVWSFGNGVTSTSTAGSITQTYNNTGVYTVSLVATDYIPCHDTTSSIVYVDSSTVISMTASDTVICRGGQVTFDGTFTTIGLTNVAWNFGDGNTVYNVNPVQHSFDATGNLTVTLTVAYRACDTAKITRNMRIYPYPSLYLGQDTSLCLGSAPLALYDDYNAGNPLASWLWNTGDTGPGITVTGPGTYSAVVSIYGCQATDTVVVQDDCYIDYINVFTPNGDGVNDYFFPRNLLTRGLTSFKMDIYNRWGQKIYATTSTEGLGWDGKFNNTPQPEGTYVYIIDATFKDGEKMHKQGNVTLMK